MPVNYDLSKVYKIYSHHGDKIYIGSTTKEFLSQRMTKHRSDYKCWKSGKRAFISSYKLFDEYGVENCFIELLEAKPCTNRDELLKLEGEYIKKMNCVNKCMRGRTKKEYYEDNKEKAKQYYKDNQEAISEQTKQYYIDNATKIKLRKSESHLCECGTNYTYAHKARHLRSLKHQHYLKTLTNIQ